MSCVVVLPLGSTVIRQRHPDLEKIRKVFGQFASMTFTVMRTGPTVFQICLKHEDALEAQETFSYEQWVGGMVGDVHRLLHGQRLTVLGFNSKGSLVEVLLESGN